jgi:hypothetical protein
MKQPTMKIRKPKENKVEGLVMTECLKRDFLCWKLAAIGRRGLPDRLVVGPGFTAFVECKRPKGGKISPLQANTLRQLKGLGQHAFIIQNEIEVMALMEYLDRLVK